MLCKWAPALLIGVWLCVCGSSAARTWYVDPDGSGDVLTIQAGIDSASAGDLVLVAGGTYTEHLNMKAGITLRGEIASAVVLEGEDTHRLMVCDGLGGETRVEDLVFENGRHSEDVDGWGKGGAAYCVDSEVTFSRCAFQNNAAGYYLGVLFQAPGKGGAIYMDGSTVDFEMCSFQENSAVATSFGTLGHGGAIFALASTTTFTDCTLEGNRTAGEGGAICGTGSAVTIHGGSVSGNTTSDGTSGSMWEGHGGGLGISSGSLVISGCAVQNNIAYEGAGIHAVNAQIEGCTLSGNIATQRGGGVAGSGTIRHCEFIDNVSHWGAGGGVSGEWIVESSSLTNNTAFWGGGAGHGGTYVGCLVAGNHVGTDPPTDCGGGLASVQLVDGCTVVGNTAASGGGICGAAEIRNSIVAFNHGGEGVTGNPAISCSDVMGNEGGDWVGDIAGQLEQNGNMHVFPLFCEPGVDYTLMAHSPCLPENNACGVQIGAFGLGCVGPIGLEPTSWGRIKASFRP